jgi:multiple RNA-binding domain-containing protein 1
MRIAIKNLPKKCTEKEIKDFCSVKGTVTDIFMLNNAKGEFRRICFVGFSNDKEAELAVEYFNSSYFQNHKITVEIARDNGSINSENMSESKLRKALYSKTIVIKHIGETMTEEEILSSLKVFGEVLKIEFQKKDHLLAIVKFKEGESAEKAIKELKVLAGKRVKVGNYLEKIVDSRLEHYNSLFFNFETVIKRTCENEKIGREDLLNLNDKDLGAKMSLLETNLVVQTKRFLEINRINLSKITGKSENILILRNSDILGVIDLISGEFKVKLAPSKCLALLEFKDLKECEKCYKEMNMKRYKNQVIYCEYAPVCDMTTSKLDAGEESNIEGVSNIEMQKKVKKTNKIIVKNVPFQATEDEIKKIFSSFSHISEVRLPKKPDGTHRGFAFIVLDTYENVEKAIEYFGSSTHLYGRRLVLEKAKL